MFKKMVFAVLICVGLFCVSGCALVGAAISAGMAYGIYQGTKK